jgi:predicted Zn-dependent protease
MIVCKELVMSRSYRVHAALALGLAAGLPACAPSVQQEVAMGNQYAAQLRQELPLVEDGAAVSAFQSAVAPLKRVAARQDLDWTFHIVDSDQVNAFAVPGGHIYVFRGLIERARRYDEFAGAVAHEIGHVDLRHSAEQMGQASAANLGVSLAYLLLGRQPGQVDRVALGLGGTALFAKFSRDDEREADSVAVASLTSAGINPGGLPRMFETLRQVQEREPSKVEQWFASHPMPAERIANTERIIDNDAAARGAVRTGRRELDAFERLQRRLRQLPDAPKELKK